MEVWRLFSKTLWQTTQACRQTYYKSWGIKPVISRLLPKLLALGTKADLSFFFFKELTSRTVLKDTLPRILFVIWQSPQDHQNLLCEHTLGGKRQPEKEQMRSPPLHSSPGREREHYTPPVFISISHQIRSLADKGTSWHITSSLRRKLTRAGDPKWQWGGRRDEEVKLFFFFLTERDGEVIWTERESRGEGRKCTEGERERGEKGETYIAVAQIHRVEWGWWGRGGGAERQETKKYRDTKNSITGLALTLTFIQHGDTPSLSQSPFTAVTGEACPTF